MVMGRSWYWSVLGKLLGVVSFESIFNIFVDAQSRMRPRFFSIFNRRPPGALPGKGPPPPPFGAWPFGEELLALGFLGVLGVLGV